MDKIILTDVSLFINQTREHVLDDLGNDAFYLEQIKVKPSYILFSFYNWAFRFALHKFYYITVENWTSNPSFQNTFNRIENQFGYLFRQQLTVDDIRLISQNDRVQVAFNGKLLFIMPCHVNI